MKAALLVVDLQHALCTGDHAAYEIDRVIGSANGLMKAARAAGAPVVLIQHEEPDSPLQPGAPGWDLAATLETDPADHRLRKTACDAFHRTDLDAWLKARGVERLVVCGLQSEYCIDSTVRGALAHGYPVTLAADAHSTLDNGVLTAAQIVVHHNATLAGLGACGPRVTLRAAGEVAFTA